MTQFWVQLNQIFGPSYFDRTLILITQLECFQIKFGQSKKHTKFEKNLTHGFDKSADLLIIFSNYVCFSKSPNFKQYLFLGGVFRLTEVALKKPLLWDVCLLHMNELPFKEFFKVRNMWKIFSLTRHWHNSNLSTFAKLPSEDLKQKQFQKVVWIKSHHLQLLWRFKLWTGKFALGEKTLLDIVNKHLKTICLLTSPNNVLTYYRKKTFPAKV